LMASATGVRIKAPSWRAKRGHPAVPPQSPVRKPTITAALDGFAALAVTVAAIAALSPAQAASRHDPDAPLPHDGLQPLGSPGIHASGNDCAPDQAEAAWSRDHRLLGYYCVRPRTR